MAKQNFQSYLPKMDQVWTHLRLATKAKLSCTDDNIATALEECRQIIKIGCVEFDEDDQEFTLFDKSVSRDERIEVHVSQKGVITVGLGKAYESSFRDDIYRKIFSMLLKKLNIEACAASFIDKLYRVEAKTEKNPEDAFVSLLSGSVLAKPLAGHTTYSFNPKLYFILDQKHKVVCSLLFTSNISLEEVIAKSASEPHTFRIECAIASLDTYYKSTDEFMNLMESHKKIARSFLNSRIKPDILLPLVSTLLSD